MNIYQAIICGFFAVSTLFLTTNPSRAEPLAGTGSNVVFHGESSGDWVAHKYLKEIVRDWDHALFLERSDPTMRETYDPARVQFLFQQYKLLGRLKQLDWPMADGRESSVGMIWNCTANADFENKAVQLFLRLKKSPGGDWYILSFAVFGQIVDPPEQAESYMRWNREDLGKEYKLISQSTDGFAVSNIRNKSAFLLFYADRLIAEKRDLDAADVLRTYLVGRPDDLDRQFQLAGLLEDNDPSESTMRYRHVASRSEKFDLVRAAYSALGQEVELKVATNALQSCSFEDTDLVFFPIEDVDRLLYEEVAKFIQEHSGLNVAVLSESVPMPRPVQDLRSWYIDTMFMGFMAKIPKEGHPLVCVQLGWDPATDLENLSAEQKERFLRDSLMLMNNGNLMLKRFEHELEGMQHGSVYGSTNVTRHLRRNFPFRNKNALAYVGFTDRMVSLPGRKDCYGFSDGAYGIVSSYHFSADRTGEQEDRQRLVTRLGKQAMSTIATTLGVRRCVSPSCPKAFPRSIQSRDSVEPHYCKTCQTTIDDTTERRKLMPSEACNVAIDYMNSEDYQAAEQWRKISLASDPHPQTKYEALLLEGNILQRSGRSQEAFYSYLNLIKQYPNQPRAKGSVLSALSNLETNASYSISEKVAFYDALLSIDPTNLDWLAGKANLLCRIGEIDKAMAIIKKAGTEGVSHYTMTLAELGCWKAKGDQKQVLSCMERLLMIRPDDQYTRYHYARMLQNSRRFEESETQYRILLKQDPANEGGLRQFSILLSTMGKFDEAVEVGKRELAVRPASIGAHNSLGFTYFRMGKASEAIVLYDKAISLWGKNKPRTPEKNFVAVGADGQKMDAGNMVALTYYNKALAHKKLNQEAEALSAYGSAVEHGYPKQEGFENLLVK